MDWKDICTNPVEWAGHGNYADGLADLVDAFKEKRKQIDYRLVTAIIHAINTSGEGLGVWSQRLGIPFVEFVETLAGRIEVSAKFWDRVHEHFKPPTLGEMNRGNV